jgi:hypothetical protein
LYLLWKYCSTCVLINYVSPHTIPVCSRYKELEEYMMGIEYEAQCIIDGELPDKLARNGTTEGFIITMNSMLELGCSKH